MTVVIQGRADISTKKAVWQSLLLRGLSKPYESIRNRVADEREGQFTIVADTYVHIKI